MFGIALPSLADQMPGDLTIHQNMAENDEIAMFLMEALQLIRRPSGPLPRR